MSFCGFIFLLFGIFVINVMVDNFNVLCFDDWVLFDFQVLFVCDGQFLCLKKNDFCVCDVLLLSSEVGECWVLLILENIGGGICLFSDDYLVVEFVNGECCEVVNLEGKLDVGEQVCQMIFFGYYCFLIVCVLDGGD